MRCTLCDNLCTKRRVPPVTGNNNNNSSSLAFCAYCTTQTEYSVFVAFLFLCSGCCCRCKSSYCPPSLPLRWCCWHIHVSDAADCTQRRRMDKTCTCYIINCLETDHYFQVRPMCNMQPKNFSICSPLFTHFKLKMIQNNNNRSR